MLRAILFSTLLCVTLWAFPKEYYSLKTIQEQKEFFFDYLYTKIETKNLEILKERAKVINLLSKDLKKPENRSYKNQLLKIKWKYDIKHLLDKKAYLEKINVVPPSLALAQAAIESDFGKSRFAKEVNNIFGHWTYDEKIGIIPKKRPQGAKYFIRIFATLDDAIEAYMLNLNRNRAYKEFQDKRFMLNNINPINGLELSQTLINYSGIGKKYLSILSNRIQMDNLQHYDERFIRQIKDKHEI